MSSDVAVQPFSGSYEVDPFHSTFGFAVRHSGISTFRGTLSDVRATVAADDAGLALEGAATVESISISEPAAFRAHVLSGEFFDAENHPEVTFRSTEVRLDDDGGASVDGELTIRGVTRAVTATGSYSAPQVGLSGFPVAGFDLETTFDRRDFGLEWQAQLPGGGDALGWDVTLEIHLEVAQPGSEG